MQDAPVHLPVLKEACLEGLRPRNGGVYADLTVGGGGHAEALLDASTPDGFLLGLDRDPEILAFAQRRLDRFGGRFRLEQGDFAQADTFFASHLGRVDGVIMDLGLSSWQLDRAERGFSIYKDGPLDLRMDPGQAFSGRDLVNRGKKEELLFAVAVLGEEPRAEAVVEAILSERKKRPLLHTSDIRRLVEKVYGRRGGRIHPATRTFQGLRMLVNRELESLEEGLEAALRLLTEGGRLAVISFHSGEDRVVKRFCKARAAEGTVRIITPKPLRPGSEEVRRNRRSRSARLRIVEKDMSGVPSGEGGGRRSPDGR